MRGSEAAWQIVFKFGEVSISQKGLGDCPKWQNAIKGIAGPKMDGLV
jgi:hypothetical protein